MSEVVDLCQRLVQFPSFDGKVEEGMLFLREYLEKSGFSARLITFDNGNGKKVDNIYASYGEGHPHLLFSGHFDVVSAGDFSLWKHPPFEANIDKDILYGRGIADMKGSIACFIQACKNFTAGKKFKGKISIIISGDEEDPIVDGTNRVLEKLDEQGEIFDFALVGEPSNSQSMGDEIKVGRRGDMVLNITSYGQLSHTAYADKNVNPVYNLINLLYRLQNDKLDNGNDYFPPSNLHVTTIDVGNNASNVVPQKAFARIDIRFNSEQTYESIVMWVQKHIAQTSGQFEVEQERIGNSFLSEINEHIKSLGKIVEKHTQKFPKYSTSGGTSDARFITKYCTVAEYGLTNATIHKVNECEKVKNIELLYEIYKDFLESFFK